MSQIEIKKVDYLNEQQGQQLLDLLDAYAQDPMGGGEPLSPSVRSVLLDKLAKTPFAFSLIAYVDGQPAALANCMEGFSTFAAKPLINVHDLVVLKAFRGQGLSHALLAEVEKRAIANGCCKVTLEVLSDNEIAKASYRKFGFDDYALSDDGGHALFWQKKL